MRLDTLIIGTAKLDRLCQRGGRKRRFYGSKHSYPAPHVTLHGSGQNYDAPQTCTVLSSPPEAMRVPSSDHATVYTLAL